MDGIKDQLVARLVPVVCELVLDNFDDIERYLMEQAASTETTIDDYVVGAALGWFKGWLQSQVK